ncbi:MAG: DUF3365 domain-containing protein [Nitrospirota bacterium]|nr:MAG: DUF3365 domain-containing protein [Nitrospirota bacterium]
MARKRKGLFPHIKTFTFVTILLVSPSLSLEAASNSSKGIAPETVSDYLNAIIRADRQVYTTDIVKRMQDQGIVLAKEDWKDKNAIPLPAQFLHYSSKIVAESGSGIRFRLISLWPIYRKNGPATPFEREGLEQLLKNPDAPQRGEVATGKMKFFQSIYADKATSQACVTCHNTHPLSPKRDFKVGDVMGAIVITIPLEK